MRRPDCPGAALRQNMLDAGALGEEAVNLLFEKHRLNRIA
jgi:hypothetical protein